MQLQPQDVPEAGERRADPPAIEPRLPPGSRAPGLLQMRRWFSDPVAFMEGNLRRHGPIFGVRLGPLKRAAMIADHAAAWEVLTGDAQVFRMGPTNRLFRPVLGDRSLFLLDGDEHRHHRRLLMPLFQPKAVRRHGDLIEEITARELAGWPLGESFALQGAMRRITTEMIVRITIGVCQPDNEVRLRELVRAMLKIAENPLALMPQFQRELGGRSPFGRVMAVTRQINEVLLEEIEIRRGLRPHERDDDVLSILTAAQPHEDAFITDREIRDELLTLLIAGHETTANGLAWTFERVLNHPVVHDRLLAELTGDDDAYLDAVVRETLRQRPILPITARRLSEPREIGGYAFPAGWTLMPSIYLIHHDPEVFPEPERFRPERFLEDPKPSSHVWIPFGAGSRHCLGTHLATLAIKRALATVLGRVTLVAEGGPEPIVRNNMTLAPGRGARVTVAGRRGSRVRSGAPVSA